MNLTKVISAFGNAIGEPDMIFLQKEDGRCVLVYRYGRHVMSIDPGPFIRGQVKLVDYYRGETYDDAYAYLQNQIAGIVQKTSASKYFKAHYIAPNKYARAAIENIDIDSLLEFVHMARSNIEYERKNPLFMYKARSAPKRKKRKKRKKKVKSPFELVSLRGEIESDTE